MKKIYLIFCVFALCLGVNSCNETYKPQVDFGKKSYVNDYSSLVKELSNQTNAITARLDALNKLLESQLGMIRISVDENTGAIKALSSQLSDDMQDVIYAMLSGFNALSTVVEQTGGRIVYAINSSGEVIALHIDKNGSLISASIRTKADELVKAINDQSLSISSRLDSLNVALSLGLARVEIKIGESGSTIDAGFKSLSDVLSGLDKDLLDGFMALKSQISATGEGLIYAVNKNGETIAFHLDCNGFLLSANLAALSKRLADTINSQSASLSEKLDSLTKALEVGLLKISVSMDQSGDEIEVKLSDINSTLGDIDKTILDGYTSVASKIDENGDKVVWAVGKNGETIALHLDQNGNLISVAVRESMESLRDILNSLETSLKQKVDAMNEIIDRALGNIYVKLGDMGTNLVIQFTDMNEALAGINAKLLDGFKKLQSAINAKGNQIVLAINESGESIVAEMDESGKLISASVLEGDQNIVSAISALDTDLGKKLEALGELLYNGLADIKVIINEGDRKVSLSVDGVSDELESLKALLDASLGQISSDLQVLNTTEKSNGKKIVSALNSNGELIALHLDSNGKLISAQIKSSVKDLIKVINSWITSFEEKMDALNAVIEAGFATIHVDLGNLGSMLSVQYTQMNEALADMNKNLLNGFTLVGKAIDGNGAAVALAVNEKGDKIIAELDETGRLISTSVLKGDKLIVSAIANFQASFEEKIEALNDLLNKGLADVTASIDGAARKIRLSVNGVSDELSDMNGLLSTALAELDDDLDLISQSIDNAGNTVVKAMNKNGRTLTLTIAETGELLSAKLGELSMSLDQLKEALADQNRELADKLALLNQAITDGIASVVLSINAQTGKIEVGMGALKDALDAIVDKLTVLNTSVKSNGDRIVSALDSNGSLIALHLDSNGNLISTQVKSSVDDLIKAINSWKASFEEKLGALNTLIEAGFATIHVDLGNLGSMLSVQYTQMNEALAGMNKTLLDGFTLVGKAIDGNGAAVALAVNEKGDKIIAELDETGKLISTSVLKGDKLIVSAIANFQASFEEKIEALNELLEGGLADIKASIDDAAGTIKLSVEGVSDELSGMYSLLSTALPDLGADLQLISRSIDTAGNRVVKAMNKNGRSLTLTIAETGELLSAKLGDISASLAALKEALADQNKELAYKLALLNQAITDGIADVVLSVNAQTGKIEVGMGELKDALDDIVAGLEVLNTTEKSNGDSIVSALNSNGELIALHLDSNGNLIAAQVKSSVKDLIKAINSWKASFEEKMDALNTLVEAGFATIHVDLGNLGSMLSVQYTQMNEALAGMNRNLLNGFTLVGEAIEGNGAAVALAVNENGDKIVAELDETGKLISTTVLKGDKLIVAAIADFQASFEEKIEALNDLLEGGLADIKASIDDAARTIKLSVEGVSDEISSMKSLLSTAITGLDADLKLISQGIDTAGGRIVTAMNANGEALTLKIGETGNVLSAKLGEISASLAALKEALADQNKELADKLDLLNQAITDGIAEVVLSINAQTGKIEVGMGNLKTSLDAIVDKLTVLGTKVDANGTTIANAITTEGGLIEAAIKANGELIKVNLVGKLDEILQALKNQSTSAKAISDKLDAMNTTVNTGLGDISAKIEAQTGDLNTQLTDVNSKLSGAGRYLASMTTQFESINGNLTKGFKAIADSLGKVVVNLGKIKVAIDDNTEAILTLDDDLQLKLQNVADSVGRVGGKMVLAINTQGNAIALALGKDGDLVKAIDLGTAQLKNIWEALKVGTHRLDSILIAGNAISTAILNALGVAPGSTDTILAAIKANKVDLTEVINQLKTANRTLSELLAISDGVYLDTNDTTYVVEDGKKVLKYKYIYVTAAVREAASKSSEVDEGLMSLLVGKTMAEPSKEQIVPSSPGTYEGGTIHYHCFWKKIEESKPFLKYVETVTDADNKTLLKMEKYYSESVWIVKIYDACSNGHIYGILVNDARNIDKYVQYYKSHMSADSAKVSTAWNKGLLNKSEEKGAGNDQAYMGPIKVKFVSYVNETGTFCSSPSAKIYCQAAGSSSAIDTKCKDGSAYGAFDNKDNKDDGWWTSESKYNLLQSTRDEPYATFPK